MKLYLIKIHNHKIQQNMYEEQYITSLPLASSPPRAYKNLERHGGREARKQEETENQKTPTMES